MSLQEQINQEMKQATLARDMPRLSTLRLLKSALGYAQIEQKKEALADPEVVAVIQKEVKKRRDAIEQYEKGGRPERAAQEKEEITVLERFLPQPLSAQELEQVVKETIRETGATSKKQMGQVISAVRAKAAGRADGKTISDLVGKLLP